MQEQLLSLRKNKKRIKKLLYNNENIISSIKSKLVTKYLKLNNKGKDYISFSMNKKMRECMEKKGMSYVKNLTLETIIGIIIKEIEEDREGIYDGVTEEVLKETLTIDIDSNNKIFIRVR